MLTLTRTELEKLTGQELLELVQRQQLRQTGDVKVDTITWRVYSSTCRGSQRGVIINLWRPVPDGEAIPQIESIQGLTTQRIGEMQVVRPTLE